MRRVEVLLEVCNHAVAWIAVRAQERMVITDGVDALANLLLVETLAGIARRERLDCALLALDILLDITPRAALGVDFLGRNRDEVVPE